MKPQNLLYSILLSGLLPGIGMRASGQDCGDSTRQQKSLIFSNLQLTGGQLTLPFKIRPNQENHAFRLTTDVTIGGFLGVSAPLSKKHNYRLTLPLTAGLTFVNLEEDNSSLDLEAASADVVPGITWSTGLILQLEHCNIGLVFGKDYASNVGDQWQYHGKWWWSFAIGYSFLGEK